MSDQNYIVLVINNGNPGIAIESDNHEHAVRIALDLIIEHMKEKNNPDILKELTEDTSHYIEFLTESGWYIFPDGLEIYILMTEKHEIINE